MRILLIGGSTRSLFSFRGDLLRDMLQLGHSVTACGPNREFSDELKAMGVDFELIPFNPSGMNPLQNIALYLKFRRLIRRVNPDLVFTYTSKPVIFGSLAARVLRVKRAFAMITGVGYGFREKGLKAKVAYLASVILYRIALKSCDKVFFQNPDDRDEFCGKGIISLSKSVLVAGSGVNLDFFRPHPIGDKPIFLMISRILRSKGIEEYIRAARLVKSKYPNARFYHKGRMDPNPTSMSAREFASYVDLGIIEHLEWERDVRPALEQCSVFVLPSYHEGTPRSVLEAMATGRPVITTDVPGCRETVIDGDNGFLIPPYDHKALADKMLWMIEHPIERKAMGKASLNLVRRKFDVRKVNEKMLTEMGLLGREEE